MRIASRGFGVLVGVVGLGVTLFSVAHADPALPQPFAAAPPAPTIGTAPSFGLGGPAVGGRESVADAAPKTASPAPTADAQATPDPRTKVLDELFQRLKGADEQSARGIAGAIERVWLRSGSDTADLLMNRAMTALGTKNYTVARELLDKVVILEPDWAEAWNKRATTRFMNDDERGAMEDIAHTLKLEPRHFGAITGMGFILEDFGQKAAALQVFRRALEIFPGMPSIRKLVDTLTIDVEGRDI